MIVHEPSDGSGATASTTVSTEPKSGRASTSSAGLKPDNSTQTTTIESPKDGSFVEWLAWYLCVGIQFQSIWLISIETYRTKHRSKFTELTDLNYPCSSDATPTATLQAFDAHPHLLCPPAFAHDPVAGDITARDPP
jgi:hypothetical protein